MIRAINVVEKNISVVPAKPVVVPAITPTDVLTSIADQRGEWSGRYIQNVGANPCYYAFGQDCDNVTNYHGILSTLQQLDCSNHGMRVSVYSVLGTTIAPTILKRNDNITQLNIATGNMNVP